MPRSAQPAALKAAAGAAASSSRAGSEYPPAAPPPPPSQAVAQLRRDYRWAAISQFLFTFGEAFGLIDWDIENLEREIEDPEIAVGLKEEQLFPEIVTKLLYALTYDRTVNKSNFFDKLRNQYSKRLPRANLFAAETTWASVPLPTRVQVVHQLCEWQLADPMRFRALLKSEEDAVQWRIEPCGWDKDGNVYWLFDDNRLWVQHPPPPEPKPPKAAAAPQKKGASKASKKAQSKASRAAASKSKSSKKAVVEDEEEEAEEDELPQPKRSILNDDLVTLSGGRTRSRAKPAQAAAPAPATPTSRRAGLRGGPSAPPSPATAITKKRAALEPAPESSKRTRLTSTRSTRRGQAAEDVWQEVPAEWLEAAAPAASTSNRATRANGRNRTRSNGVTSQPAPTAGEESDSDLTDLSSIKSASPERTAVDKAPSLSPAPALDSAVEGNAAPATVGGAAKASADGTNGMEATQEPDQEVEAAAEAEDVAMAEPVSSSIGEAGSGQRDDAGKVEPELPDANEAERTSSAVKANGRDMQVDASAAKEDPDRVGSPPKSAQEESQAAETADSKPEVKADAVQEVEEEPFDESDEVQVAVRKAATQTWLEWECVCVSRYDWENFPLRFKGSKHVDEKAFYSYLMDNICPDVIAALRQREIEIAKQQAILNRKRSSRIQMKEQEKEEQLAKEKAQREMEERMQRARNQEARAAREEAEKVNVEQDRETRLREREERLRQREAAAMQKALDEVEAKERAERERDQRMQRRETGGLSQDGTASPRPNAASPSHLTLKIKRPAAPPPRPAETSANWELACEVCGQHGWNVADKSPMAGCELCGRWQHIACHDRRDDAAGRPRRNWDKVDFFCGSCQRRIARERQSRDADSNRSATQPRTAPSNGSSSARSAQVAGPQSGGSSRPNNQPRQPPVAAPQAAHPQHARVSSHASDSSMQRQPAQSRPPSTAQSHHSYQGQHQPQLVAHPQMQQQMPARQAGQPHPSAVPYGHPGHQMNGAAQQHVPYGHAPGHQAIQQVPRRDSQPSPAINGYAVPQSGHLPQSHGQVPHPQQQYRAPGPPPAQHAQQAQYPPSPAYADPRQQQQMMYAQQQQHARAAQVYQQQQMHGQPQQPAMTYQQHQQWLAAQGYPSQGHPAAQRSPQVAHGPPAGTDPRMAPSPSAQQHYPVYAAHVQQQQPVAGQQYYRQQ